MMRKFTVIFLFLITLLSAPAYSQIGVRAGVNLADQSFQGLSDNVSISSLTAFHVGLVYQLMPDNFMFKWIGFGFETGTMFSQKGSMFNALETNQTGYNELNYIEVPLNLHLRLKFGKFGLYAYGGMYAASMINGKTISDEASETSEKWKLTNFNSRFDYGYSVGGGIDVLRKLQIGLNYSHGLRNLLPEQYINDDMQTVSSIFNRVCSVNITFLF